MRCGQGKAIQVSKLEMETWRKELLEGRTNSLDAIAAFTSALHRSGIAFSVSRSLDMNILQLLVDP